MLFMGVDKNNIFASTLPFLLLYFFFFFLQWNSSRRLVKSFFIITPMPCVFRELRVK